MRRGKPTTTKLALKQAPQGATGPWTGLSEVGRFFDRHPPPVVFNCQQVVAGERAINSLEIPGQTADKICVTKRNADRANPGAPQPGKWPLPVPETDVPGKIKLSSVCSAGHPSGGKLENMATGSADHSANDSTKWTPRSLKETRLRELDAQMAPVRFRLRCEFERACLLAEIGRTAEARDAYLDVLRRNRRTGRC